MGDGTVARMFLFPTYFVMRSSTHAPRFGRFSEPGSASILITQSNQNRRLLERRPKEVQAPAGRRPPVYFVRRPQGCSGELRHLKSSQPPKEGMHWVQTTVRRGYSSIRGHVGCGLVVLFAAGIVTIVGVS